MYFLDQCQHAELISARHNNEVLKRTEEVNLIGISHGERNYTQTKNTDGNEDKNLFSTGILSHDLSLKSVYKHDIHNVQFEATTYQDKWVVVDYIFYRLVT